MVFKTWVTEKLGVKYPILQGAMQWLSCAELAAAVSNADGLGFVGANNFHSAEEFRREIRKTRDLTDKPFGANITLMPTRRPVNYEEYIAVAIEEGINIIETSGRSPEPYMEMLKQSKATLLHRAARLKDARTVERLGIDAVTLLGYESGGHIGTEDVTTLVLIPRAVDSLKIPVLAAGGFGDGRGLVAALALGAQGILMGTRLMASKESPIHPKIKELLVKTQETDTMIIERSIKNASRVVNTDFAQKVLEMEERGATLDELYPFLAGARVKQNYDSGNVNDAIIYCGQAVGLVNKIQSVKEIIDSIVSEAEIIHRRLQGILQT